LIDYQDLKVFVKKLNIGNINRRVAKKTNVSSRNRFKTTKKLFRL